jgi:cyclase
MLLTRIIPVLLIQNNVLVKTKLFRSPTYIGDPINAIKIFNEKEVDELVILDISATHKKTINFELLSKINKEAFMPVGYGGGISSLNDIQKILSLGYEKIVLNHIVLSNPNFISEAAKICGNQSIVVCIDVKKYLGRFYVYDYVKKKRTKYIVEDWIKKCEQNGAGEIIIQDVDKEGTFSGYNLKLFNNLKNKVQIPVIALGGASSVSDLKKGLETGVSAVAAGSMFVFYGPYKAVLITYVNKAEI